MFFVALSLPTYEFWLGVLFFFFCWKVWGTWKDVLTLAWDNVWPVMTLIHWAPSCKTLTHSTAATSYLGRFIQQSNNDEPSTLSALSRMRVYKLRSDCSKAFLLQILNPHRAVLPIDPLMFFTATGQAGKRGCPRTGGLSVIVAQLEATTQPHLFFLSEE